MSSNVNEFQTAFGNINYKSISCENIPEIFLDKLIAKKYFGRFGRINRFILYPKRLSCIVEYEKEEDAKNAYENAGNYNGHYFNIRFTTNEAAHMQNTEEWVDPEVQAELDAMGNPSQISSRGQRMKAFSSRMKPILKPATKPSVVDIPKIDLVVKQELETILKKQALDVEEKYQILDARDKLIRLTTVRTTDIRKAVSIKGTCPDMCPEKERLMREAKRQISIFEMDTERNTMNHRIAVKEYSRSSADQETPLAHELRPEPILKMTMTYLMQKIMDVCEDTDTNLGEWYHFLWDRTRSIRKDITQQELCSLESVQIVEQCARFHIHCAARLIAEELSVFDPKINTENLTKCLQTLKYMYHDLRLKNIKCPNETEFRSYVILLNLNDGNFLWELRQLPDDIQNSTAVREAFSFYLAIDSHNYVKFFQLIKKTTYMNACILLRYFNQVRVMAIRIMMKAYKPSKTPFTIPLSYLKNILAFESEYETATFLNYYGLGCDDNNIIIDRNTLYEPDLPYAMERSLLVESKREVSVGEAVCGIKLDFENEFENYIPHDSFDENGFLKEDAWSAEDQIKGDDSEQSYSEDENVFKIPRASPPISAKQQSKGLLGSKLGKIMMPPSVFSSTSTNLFSKDTTDNCPSNTSIFGVEPTKENKKKNLPAFQSIAQISGGSGSNLFQHTTSQATKTDSATNIFKDYKQKQMNNDSLFQHFQEKPNFNLFSHENISTISQQNIFGDHKVNKIQEAEDNYKKLREDEEKRNHEEVLRKQLEMEKRKEKEEKKRKQIEKEEHEKKMKDITKKSEQIYSELLEEVFSDEVQMICTKEVQNERQMIQVANEIHRKIIDEQIDTLLREIIAEEAAVFLRAQEIIRKYFRLWREKVKKRIERQKIIKQTPVWLPEESLAEQASKLLRPHINETLGMMKRYRLGVPNIFGLVTERKQQEPINLFTLFSKILGTKTEIIDTGLLKRRIYFKCIISLPDEPQNYHEHENSKGFYSYMSNRLQKYLAPNQNDPSKEFLCECQGDICICLRKVSGIYPKNENNQKVTFECDNSNAILFIMTSSSVHNSQKRLINIINSSHVHILQKVPIAIVVYNSSIDKDTIIDELNLEHLLMNNQISGYRIFEMNEKENRNNIRSVLEETFRYLINSFDRRRELEMQQLPLFLVTTLGEDFWRRLNDSWLNNPAFRKFCTAPENVVNLYIEAIDKLCGVIEENIENVPEFPEELKQFVADYSYDTPVEIEYFPKDWKKVQSESIFRVQNFLKKIKPKKFNKSLDGADLDQVEKILFEYAKDCIPLEHNRSQRAAYSAIKVLLEMLYNPDISHLPVSSRFNEISWLNIIKCIMLELLQFTWDVDSKYLPKNIIYKKESVRDFINSPWWLKIESIKTIKVISSANIEENEDDDDDGGDDENYATPPEPKRIRNNLNLDSLMAKASAMIEKAERNIEKFHKYSTINRNVSRDLDMAFYHQEKINQAIKKFLYENSDNK